MCKSKVIGKAKCHHCGHITTTGGIRFHIENCKENPLRKKQTQRDKVMSAKEANNYFRKIGITKFIT